MNTRSAGLVLLPLCLAACDGLFQESWAPSLGVPYVPQQNFNYCVPASISMWRAYDGLATVSQDHIWNTLGGAPCDGLDAALGVRLFTSSGFDAYLDLEDPFRRDDFMARQVTSIDSRVPVMVIVNPFRNHVGIVNGGSYQYTASTGEYTWNTVLFHDPAIGPDEQFTSNDWIEWTCHSSFSYCGQIISNAASFNWASNVQAFGPSVDLYDGTDSCCLEEKNQN